MNLTLVRFGYLGECKSSGLLSFFANFKPMMLAGLSSLRLL